MSDNPKSMSLDPAEWRAVLIQNAQRLLQYVQNMQFCADEQVASTEDHMGRMLTQMKHGWKVASVAFQQAADARHAPNDAVQQPASTVVPDVETSLQPNGADPAPKRKGGWPKGQKRKPREAQPETVQ